jgi:hypothetical protein
MDSSLKSKCTVHALLAFTFSFSLVYNFFGLLRCYEFQSIEKYMLGALSSWSN